jgi:plastocyanin
MLSLRLAVVSALLMSAVACGESNSSTPTSPSPSPSPSPTQAPTPTPGGVSSSVVIPVGAEFLGNRGFTPTDLDVQVGTTVTWMNTDRDSHTTTSDAPGWNSGTISPGRQFSFTFQTAGTFPYHCTFHPGMIGRIVVAAASSGGSSER